MRGGWGGRTCACCSAGAAALLSVIDENFPWDYLWGDQTQTTMPHFTVSKQPATGDIASHSFPYTPTHRYTHRSYAHAYTREVNCPIGCAIDSACKHACMRAPDCACMSAAPAISGGRTRRPANAVGLELFQRRRQCDTLARTDCGAHTRARAHTCKHARAPRMRSTPHAQAHARVRVGAYVHRLRRRSSTFLRRRFLPPSLVTKQCFSCSRPAQISLRDRLCTANPPTPRHRARTQAALV